MEKKFFANHPVYQIYPRSFYDSNGDGIGDINGINLKLDYLKNLGIKMVWLSPVYPSPNADYGYDVSDYYDINPEYGTLEDMDRLIAHAKRCDIRIIMDLVVNHTSDEHKWFKLSEEGVEPYADYYVWKVGRRNNKKPPNNWTSYVGGSAWEYSPKRKMWYLHLFDKKQPDLNWHNPKVFDEVADILRFWLDRGIYGFRCDVISQIYKSSYENGKNSPFKISAVGREHFISQPGCHEILKRFREEVFSKYDCIVIGENDGVTYEEGRKFLDKELDMFFHFDIMNLTKRGIPAFRKKLSLNKFKNTIFAWQKAVDWNANYFENHDQWRSLNWFGYDESTRDLCAKMLGTILFGLRGTPFVYEGEELGVVNPKEITPDQYRDNVTKWVYPLTRHKLHFSEKLARRLTNNVNRDNARTPMPWSATKYAGFSRVDPWILVNPDTKTHNVADEVDKPDSVYSYYKELIALREKDDVLAYGSFEPLKTPKNCLAFFRTYEGEIEIVIVNLTPKKITLPKSIREMHGEVLISNYYKSGFSFKKKLKPYEAIIAKVKK